MVSASWIRLLIDFNDVATPYRQLVLRIETKALQKTLTALLSGRDNSLLSVMLKCGFQNAGHFARDYRRAFGARPSDTLRRGFS